MKTTYNFKIAMITFLAIFSFRLQAQDYCGYDRTHDYLMATDTAYRNEYAATNARINEIIQHRAGARMPASGVIDIPVVVHVLNIGEPIGSGSNISDAQILGAIQGMNDKYKSINGFGVDMQINFCLAVRDPNGNPTTGINRVDASGITNYVSTGMWALAGISPASCYNNYAALKDLSKWPTSSYLNIWVVYNYCVSAGLTLYGQATGQTGGVYDGVTILYSQMTQSSITLAHEVGHMLLLNHTFQGDGGGSTCPADTACPNTGDLVCDTPPHRTNDWGATNPCSPSGIWDNSRFNYMAYSWAAGPSATFNETTCRFTQGQKDRARAAVYALTSENYLNSTGCIPPALLDAGIKGFTYPISNTYTSNCSFPNAMSPVVQLRNYGSTTLTSVTISYKADGGPVNTFAWTGSLMKDSVTAVTLPSLMLSAGAHTLLAYTTNPNGAGDSFNANDSTMMSMNYKLNQVSSTALSASSTDPVCAGGSNGWAGVTAVSSPAQFVANENWEGTSDWTIVNGSEVNHWMVGTATANGGSKSIYVTANNVTTDYMISSSSSVHFYKDFYFPAGATNIKVKFDWKCQGEAGGFSGVDRLRVYLVPTSQYPQAGYQMGVAPSFTTYSIGSYYSQATFRTDSIMGLDANAGTVKRLVFNWRNNSAYGTQSAAAVDNITVSYDLPAVSGYTYSWNSTPVQTTSVANSLSAGTYTVTVMDNNNCANTASVTLSDPAPFTVSVIANDSTAFCTGDSVILSSSPATSYLWSNGDITQNTIITSAGSYSVTGTAANGCTATSSPVTVTILPAGSCSTGITALTEGSIRVFPNPASDHLIVSGDAKNGAYQIVIRNEIGQIVLKEDQKVENGRIERSVSLKEFSKGVYFLSIGSEKEMKVTRFSKID